MRSNSVPTDPSAISARAFPVPSSDRPIASSRWSNPSFDTLPHLPRYLALARIVAPGNGSVNIRGRGSLGATALLIIGWRELLNGEIKLAVVVLPLLAWGDRLERVPVLGNLAVLYTEQVVERSRLARK